MPRSIGLCALSLMFSSAAWSQLCAMEGNVIGEDGSPLKGAVIKFLRTDGDGTYKVKTDKKGHFYHGGLARGVFKIVVEVDGKDVDTVTNMATDFPPTVKTVNFDLRAQAARKAQLAKAVEGKLTAKETRKLSPEEKAAVEAQTKEREQLASKNKDLTETFNAGRAALDAKQYDVAVSQLTRAAQMDASQNAIWISLGQAYVQLGETKTGEERQADWAKACEAYQKALALKDDAALEGKYALVLVKMNKVSEAESALEKAAALDPSNAAKYYFNVGTMFLNGGQNDAAGAAFKKAIDVNPEFAEALFQYAVYLSAKMAPPGPDGKVIAPPGMKESLEKYLALMPNGPNAEAARSLLALIQGSISTSYTNPAPPKAGKKR